MTSNCQPKIKKELETKTCSQNIQSGHRDGIWHRKMFHANNEKQKMTNDGRNKNSKLRKNQTFWRKGNLQIL